jgi:hypothetical protein
MIPTLPPNGHLERTQMGSRKMADLTRAVPSNILICFFCTVVLLFYKFSSSDIANGLSTSALSPFKGLFLAHCRIQPIDKKRRVREVRRVRAIHTGAMFCFAEGSEKEFEAIC